MSRVDSPAFYEERLRLQAEVAGEQILRLKAENQQLREALEHIAAEWEGNLGTGQMLSEFCRAALAVVGEE